MLVKDVTYSGLSFVGHEKALAEIISANDCKSILDIGCLGERPRTAFYPNEIEGGWWSLKTSRGNIGNLNEITGPYDLVVVPRWLSTFSMSDIPQIVNRLYELTAKVLFVIENETTPRTDLTETRPIGWDRIDWGTALTKINNKIAVFSMSQKSPDNTAFIASYIVHTGKDGNWKVVKY